MSTAHINSEINDIADVVLMPGDPLRAKYIAEKFLTDYKLVNEVRNMLAYTGYYKGKKVTIFPSGMGVPSIGIYSYELFKFYNVEKIIRIGTAGTFQPDIKVKDIVLSSGAYCKSYFDYLYDGIDIDYIKASSNLNEDIKKVAQNKHISLNIGKTITSDVFDPYCDDPDKFAQNFSHGKYLAAEMEAFGLFYMAHKFKKEAACLLTIVDSKYDKSGSLNSEEREKALDEMILLALEAILF